MASRYVVAAGGAWSSTATWSATSGGAGGASVPTAADDVHLDANSGALTLDTNGGACLSFDCTGYTGSLTHNATVKMNGGSNLAASGLILKLVTTMTYTLVSAITSEWTFNSNNAGVIATVTCAGKTVGNMSFQGNANSSHQLVDGYTQGSGASTNLTNGTLDINGQTCTWGSLNANNTNTKSLVFGSSVLTITGGAGNAWQMPNTGLTTTASAGCSLSFTGSGQTCRWDVDSGAPPNIALSMTGSGTAILSSGNSFSSFARTGTAVKTDALTINGNPTFGTMTLAGNSITNRLLVQASTVGSHFTVTVTTSFSIQYSDFMDIQTAGAAGTWAGTSIGDAQGNTGITFDASRTLFGVGSGTPQWSALGWSLSSGGATGQNPPLPQDDVTFDVNSGSPIVSVDMPRVGRSLSTVGTAAKLNLNIAPTSYGSLNLGANTLSNNSTWTLAGRGSQTLTSGGALVGQNLTFSGPGGTYTLQDGLSLYQPGGTARSLNVNDGTLNTNGQTIWASTMGGNGTNRAKTLTAGTSIMNLYGTGSVWNWNNGTPTMNVASATINILDRSGTTKTWVSTNSSTVTYGALNIAGGGGLVQVQLASRFGSFGIAPGSRVELQNNATFTILSAGGLQMLGANWNASGFQYVSPVNGSFISSPNAPAVQIVGDLTIEARIQPLTWAVGGFTAVLTKWGGTNNSYELGLTTGGKIAFLYSTTGANQAEADSTVIVPFPDGVPGWIRASFQVSTGGNHVVTFYTSSDGVSWSQLGTPVSVAGAVAIFNGTQPIEFGSSQGGVNAPLSARFYRGRIYSLALGSGAGTPVFDADFSTKTWGSGSFTESSTNAATVTITGANAQAGDGRINLVNSLVGTTTNGGFSVATGNVSSDYLVLQDMRAAGGATFYAGSHSVNVSNNVGWTFADAPAPGSVPAGVFDPDLNPTAWF